MLPLKKTGELLEYRLHLISGGLIVPRENLFAVTLLTPVLSGAQKSMKWKADATKESPYSARPGSR
jgi:hypothetical protein